MSAETTDFEQLKGYAVSSIDRVNNEEGDYVVIDFAGGLRLYADAPTLYAGPNYVPAARARVYPDPPEDLADAWRRFQGEGAGGVSTSELCDIEEWRGDCERDAFGA